MAGACRPFRTHLKCQTIVRKLGDTVSVSSILSITTMPDDGTDPPAPVMDSFTAYILPILMMEGGLTDAPADGGGVTNFGITEATARAAGYTAAMADMAPAEAEAIYRADFWVAPQFDQIDPIMPTLAAFLLESGINLGPHTPSTYLQRALNVLNNQGTLYPAIAVDGVCGPLTRAALKSYLTVRDLDNGEGVLLGVLRSLTAVNYVEIAEANPSQSVFEYGWLRVRALDV
jgi:lysozyme family protein